jgi:amino acid permease
MSLEPHWFSTIFGVLLMAGMAVSAFCFAIAMLVLLSREEPLAGVVSPMHMHDLGKLLFAFVMVWAYFALSQFLIIYGGNLPEEIPWYLRRLRGGWEWVGLAIVLLHFALPFFLLLMRRVKRDSGRLVKVALLIFGIRLVDLYWMVAPAWGESGGIHLHWLDLAAPVAVGGLWLWMFTRELGRMPLLPVRDPYLQEALSHGHH